MLSKNHIMLLLSNYAQSNKGKKEIKKKYGVDYDQNKDSTYFKTLGERMKFILYQHTNQVINSISPDDIVVSKLKPNKNGHYITISFKKDSLRRDSLNKERYPEGAYDIVLLFSRGYRASNYAYGFWKIGGYPKSIRSRKSRNPNSFLFDAVNEFNSAYGKTAVASLRGKYRIGGTETNEGEEDNEE